MREEMGETEGWEKGKRWGGEIPPKVTSKSRCLLTVSTDERDDGIVECFLNVLHCRRL